jgi:hypothetical protein
MLRCVMESIDVRPSSSIDISCVSFVQTQTVLLGETTCVRKYLCGVNSIVLSRWLSVWARETQPRVLFPCTFQEIQSDFCVSPA